MACVKMTAESKLIVKLFSGKCLSAPELSELDVNWAFFTMFVRQVKNVLGELPQTRGWAEIRANLPRTAQGGACNWQDIVVLLLVAPLLTQNNIAALCRLLDGSPGLCAVLGLAKIPSQGRISHYKNHLLGEPCFVRLRLKLAGRLKRHGTLGLNKLVIDGAPLFARANPRQLSMRQHIPYGAIWLTFQALNLTWTDYYYPQRAWNQTPTSTVLIYYLLMYWLGMRSLGGLHKWLTKHLDILNIVGLSRPLIPLRLLWGFRGRFERFIQAYSEAEAPFRTVEDLLRAVCAEVQLLGHLAEILQLDQLRTNDLFFNLFRFRPRVIDPDAMSGYCNTRKRHFLGYRLLLIVDASTKLPLFGCVFPGNREEGSAAPQVLDSLIRAFSLLDDLALPHHAYLFGDLAYDKAPVAAWAHQHTIRLLIVSKARQPRHTARWARAQRIRVEHGLSDLTAFFGLNQLRTITLPYVQIFVEIILTSRMAQGLVALEHGHPEELTAPTYPAFGR